MKIPYYQINAFTTSPHGGNPAGVCVLQDWLSDRVLQDIAAENNLSETAYIIDRNTHYDLRWFTPTIEVDLCGHATLASAFVVLNHLEPKADSVTFSSKSGMLTVTRKNEMLELHFPALPATPTTASEQIIQALGVQPQQVLESKRDIMVVLANEKQVHELRPDMAKLVQLDKLALMVTATGTDCDFVSRFFSPQAGIPEDPVTGSSFCTLAPYWADRLNLKKLHARQLSSRGGEIWCEPDGKRVKIAGHALLFLSGTIYGDD